MYTRIKRSPYEGTGWHPFQIGIERTSSRRRDVWHLIENEEDLEEAVTGLHDELRDSESEKTSCEQLNPRAWYRKRGQLAKLYARSQFSIFLHEFVSAQFPMKNKPLLF